MSRLLVNGCSYGVWWKNTSKLGDMLGFDETVNISVNGSSNARILRTTMDYVYKESVDYIIVSLTFWDREEAPWTKPNSDHNLWISYSSTGINLSSRDNLLYDYKLYEDYIHNRYKYDLGNIHYLDKLVDSLLMFCTWLDSKNIKYLIFSPVGGEYYNFNLIPNLNYNKIQEIYNNKRILNLDSWSSNEYLFNNGVESDNKDLPPRFGHYNDVNNYLDNYLYNYITSNNL